MRLRRLLSCFPVFLLVLAAPALHASLVIYTYEGHPFTDFSGSVPSGLTHLSMSFEFASALPANLHGNVTGSIVSWSVFDGADTFTQATPGTSLVVLFNTNSLGKISNYSVSLLSPGRSQSSVPGLDYLEYDTQNDYALTPSTGSWTMTPEPSAAVLMLSGARLLFALHRRRSRA